MGPNQLYQKVLDVEVHEVDQSLECSTSPPAQSTWKKRILLVSLAFCAILVAILTAIVAFSSTPSASHSLEFEFQHCGSTPAAARAHDCVYDVMMQLWTPRACYDSVLSETFLAAGNWTWWADADASHEMSDEVIRQGEHEVVYVSPDYHKTHCIFAWEKLVRALRNNSPLIEQDISYDHTTHCRHKALAADDAKGAIAKTGYTRCAPYDVWLAALTPSRISSVD